LLKIGVNAKRVVIGSRQCISGCEGRKAQLVGLRQAGRLPYNDRAPSRSGNDTGRPALSKHGYNNRTAVGARGYNSGPR
jgi:hypothetical protein